ncbi:unnamed protein product, partial [Didymodactylos carnosus]
EFDGTTCYRLTNSFQDREKALDIAAYSNKATMVFTRDYSKQCWYITSLGDDYYRLTNKYKGEGKSLTYMPSSLTIEFAPTSDEAGQYWKLLKSTDDTYTYRLTNKLNDGQMWVDIVNTGTASSSSDLTMTEWGPYSGQFWKIESFTCGDYCN